MSNLANYYSKRAGEYDRIYLRPERQSDLARLTDFVRRELSSRSVLEIACGTGYWTERFATIATCVYATDINREVLNIAKRRVYPPNRVSFLVTDACQLDSVKGDFNAAFAGFWWSHILRQELPKFLKHFMGE